MCMMTVCLCIDKFMNLKIYEMLYLQVYNVARIRNFDAVYTEKVFFPNKSDIRGINANGKTSLELQAGLFIVLLSSIVCIQTMNRSHGNRYEVA